MKSSFRRHTHHLCAVAIFGIAILGMSQSANAAIEIFLTVTSGATTDSALFVGGSGSNPGATVTNTSNALTFFTYNLNNVLISVQATSTNSSSTDRLDIASSIVNLNAGAVNVSLYETDTSFTLPGVAPGSMRQFVSNVTLVNSNASTFQSFLDTTNKFFASGPTNPDSPTPGTASPGTPPSPSGLTPGLQNAGNGFSAPFVPFIYSPNYSLANTSTYAISGAGTQAALTGSSVVQSPEPATFALALAGVPAAGVFMLRRRSRGKAAV